MRYYTGTYNEELVFNQNPGLNPANSNSIVATQYSSSPSQPRSSTSSSDLAYSTPSRKQPSRPSLATDDYTRSSSPSRSVDPSPIDRQGPTGAMYEAQMRRTATERAAVGTGLPSSLPDSSPLSSVPALQDSSRIERANSELGHYPDLTTDTLRSAQPRQHSPERHRPRDVYEVRQTNYSSSNLAVNTANPLDRAPSPEKPSDTNPRVKISGPMNGAPIPTGFKFGGGGKDASSDGNSSAERREKAKSRSFWGFGKPGGGGRFLCLSIILSSADAFVYRRPLTSNDGASRSLCCAVGGVLGCCTALWAPCHCLPLHRVPREQEGRPRRGHLPSQW